MKKLNYFVCANRGYYIELDWSWEVSHSFKDFESGLIYVHTVDQNESRWLSGAGMTRQPQKSYILEPKHGKVIIYEEWKAFFNYDMQTIYTEDGMFKYTRQRKYDDKVDCDYIDETLVFLKGGHVTTSQGVAFYGEKRDTLLESTIKEIRERIRIKQEYTNRPSIVDFSKGYEDKLEDYDILFAYYKQNNVVLNIFDKGEYKVYELNKSKQFDFRDLVRTGTISPIIEFSSIKNLWESFVQNEDWYLKYVRCYNIKTSPFALTSVVLDTINELHRQQSFTFKEYEQINSWINLVYSDEYRGEEIKQWCSNCHSLVKFYSRYPKHICRECSDKKMYDKNGLLLDIVYLGYDGIEIKHLKSDNVVEKTETTFYFDDCHLDGKIFIAQPARFGGIVFQLKENSL